MRGLSKKFGKAPRTLFRWAKNGVIPSGFILGGSRVWRVADIDAFIAKLQNG